MAIGNTSFATVTNVRFGSSEMKDVWWNAQDISIPNISMNAPRTNSRAGATAHTAPDTAVYGDLGVTFILDKEWKVYDSIYNYFLEGLNVENGKFSFFKTFDLWCEFVDGNGEVRKKFFFKSCRLTDFQGLQVTAVNDEDELQVLEVNFSVLYYSHFGGDLPVGYTVPDLTSSVTP